MKELALLVIKVKPGESAWPRRIELGNQRNGGENK